MRFALEWQFGCTRFEWRESFIGRVWASEKLQVDSGYLRVSESNLSAGFKTSPYDLALQKHYIGYPCYKETLFLDLPFRSFETPSYDTYTSEGGKSEEN